jgi:uncharacterized protein
VVFLRPKILRLTNIALEFSILGMSNVQSFTSAINTGYTFKGSSIVLGGAVFETQSIPGVHVNIPLAMMNRHGLIAGATGTGKTKTIQRLCESLSENGVPVLIMDIKGDVSGLSQPGTTNEKIESRHKLLNISWQAKQFPVEFLTISAENGVRMRATVTEFGPVLFAKMLELNDTQGGVMAMVYKYCDDKKLPLIDLEDLKAVLQYLMSDEGKIELKGEYGSISPATVGTIMRKVIELEQQGAASFFGETSFDVRDLTRTDSSGKGFINIMRVTDIQAKPKLFSTFMLSLLTEIYSTFPEEGEVAKPKLCIFIDEAHLIFDQASKNLLDQIEMVIKLIRSKGIGIYFITQNPIDIPEAILAQLGTKIQHALRAFTANDRKAITQASQNYPETKFYKVSELITALGIGEAFVTVLDERGNPTPLVHTMLLAPQTRMDTISPNELDTVVQNSMLAPKYRDLVERDSARELLARRIEQAAIYNQEPEKTASGKPAKQEPSFLEELSKNTMVKQIGRTVTGEITRGILGMLGLGRRR